MHLLSAGDCWKVELHALRIMSFRESPVGSAPPQRCPSSELPRHNLLLHWEGFLCSAVKSLPQAPVSPLSRVLSFHHGKKLNWLGVVCPHEAQLTVLHHLFSSRWLQIDYLTVYLNSFPTTGILSWPVNDDEDKTFLSIAKLSSLISPLYDFKDSGWWPYLITNICWWLRRGLLGPPGWAPSPAETSLIAFPILHFTAT